MKNGHQKRIFSKNVFQGGDFSKRRGFAVLVTYGWKKTEVIEKRLRHSTLRAGGFSLAWLLAFTMSFAPLASRVVGLLYAYTCFAYTPDKTSVRRVRRGVRYQ